MHFLRACSLLASELPWMEAPAALKDQQGTLTIRKALALAIVKRRREATSTIKVRRISKD